MMLSMMVACGSDGDDNSSYGNVSGGVNVRNGKKLVKMSLISNEVTNSEELNIKINYDTNNRISTIVATQVQTDKSDITLAKFDYNLKAIQIYDLYSYKNESYKIFAFYLNEKGWFSQIGNCICKYDQEGYLTGVECPSGEIWTLAYQENNLVRSLVDGLSGGRAHIYNMFYSQTSNQGESLVTINVEDSSNKRSYYSSDTQQNLEALVAYIAYQSGLFGNIMKFCTTLSSSDEMSAVLSKIQKNNTITCNFKFTFE